MGLDAHVRCNCSKEEKTKPFPFPGRLRFDKCGEPFLANVDGTASEDLTELLQFDGWQDNPGCEHDGFLVQVRIGNMSSVALIREWVKATEAGTGRSFPVLLQKVVYNGTHAGDCLSISDTQLLTRELENLNAMIENANERYFLATMKRLCEASLASGNPIVF